MNIKYYPIWTMSGRSHGPAITAQNLAHELDCALPVALIPYRDDDQLPELVVNAGWPQVAYDLRFTR